MSTYLPSNTDRIYLTGFMGSGKSTVGRILAGLLERTFVDLDEAIVRKAGMSIPEIFRLEGEAAFRKREAEMAAVFTSGEWVVALGGGTLVDPGTRELLISGGIVAYLRAGAATLADRLRDQRKGRPLLDGEDSLEEIIAALMEARERIYSLAHWTIDTDGLTPEQVAGQLFERIRNQADV